MTTTDAEPSGRDQLTRRYPCPWCESAEMWPDGCTESIDAPVDAPADVPDVRCCVATIEQQCWRGDHRRCQLGRCTVSARWHEPVREAGIAAAQEAGHAWAIVSTINNTVEVIDTADDITAAKLILRTVLSNAGRLNPEGKGLVYVVRSSDGGFL